VSKRSYWCLIGTSLAAAIALGGCAGGRAVSGPTLVWPPPDVEAPGAVEWVGAFAEVKPGGMGGFFREVAGGEQSNSKWRLRRPTAVAVNERRIAVVDGGSGTVVLADTVGRHASILDLPDGFLPVAVAVSKDGGTWFVADGPTGEIRRFDDQGRSAGVIRPQGEITRCGGIAATGNGDLLLTDVDAGELLRLTSDGMVIARTGGRGIEPGQFNRPTAVVEDPDGTVWVLDALNFRVQHLDSRLRHLGQFGTHGDGSGHLALPRGLTVDPDGHLYVSDAQFDLIQLFDPDGRLLLTVGRRGDGNGEFWSPAGLACDAAGTLVVADAGNRRIQVLEYRRRRTGP
jgi:DNA-binding beta-propeller fold protein YncE